MRKSIILSVMVSIMMPLMVGCNNERTASSNKKVDVLFVGPTQNVSSFKKASVDAKSHYDKIRAARKAKEEGRYDDAIKIYSDSLPSAEFKFEKAVIYMNLADIYAIKHDLENEMKYRLLDAENTGNENVKKESLQRAEEIRKMIES